MRYCAPFIVIVIFLSLPYTLISQDLHLSFSIQTTHPASSFPFVAANKNWDKGEIIDLTSNHNLGFTRSSGKDLGWAISLQPNGSWAWNIGTGERRLDYMPTVQRQPLADGQWHTIGWTFAAQERIVRLYYDRELVAVYSLDDLKTKDLQAIFSADSKWNTKAFQIKDISTQPILYTPTETPNLKGNKLNLICWNIWHGGRRDGNEAGLKTTISTLKASRADIVCMQETYGSGPIIADSLGYIFYYRSSNLSIHSPFPIVETHPTGDPFRIGGLTIQLRGDQQIRVFSLWINSSPDVDKTIPEAQHPDSLIALEHTTRLKEVKAILDGIQPLGTSIPIIVAGDFNSPSHLDWTKSARNWHRNMEVAWPVSKAMIGAGYQDAFRLIHPEPTSNYGRTWSPRFIETACHERIDHVYFMGKSLQPISANMWDQAEPRWPSDHAAVLVTFLVP